MKPLIRLVLLLAVAGLAALGFASTAHAVTPVTPQAPTWHQATCSQPAGSVDIPTQAGVDYALDTIPGLGGNYLLGVGTHTVDASAQPGYVFFPIIHPPVTHWTFTVVSPGLCVPSSILTDPPPHIRVWTFPPAFPPQTAAHPHRHHHHKR